MDESSKETSGERQSQEPEAAKLTNETPAGDTPETPEPAAGETPADDTAVEASSAAAKSAPVPAVTNGQRSPARVRGAAVDSALPMVWSPNLGDADVNADEILESPGSEHLETDAEAADEQAESTAKAASPQRSLRIVMVAVALAGAAAIGSFIGSLSATGVEHFWPVADRPRARRRRSAPSRPPKASHPKCRH